ncbi:MAG: glycosyltransferase family 4 protein [Thermoplasmata archaeon]
MKVLVVGDYYPDIGGVTQYTHNLAVGLIRNNIKVHILQTRAGKSYYSKSYTIFRLPASLLRKMYMILKGLPYIVYLLLYYPPIFLNFKTLLNTIFLGGMLSELLRKNTYHLVHSNHLALRSLIACIVAHKHRVPCVVTSHGYDTERPESVTEFLLRKATIELADRVITLTRTKFYMLNSLYGNSNKFIVIPNFINCYFDNYEELLYAKKRTKNAMGLNDKFVILYLGRLVKEKGIYDIIKLSKLIQNISSRYYIFIVGDGPELQQLKAEIEGGSLKGVYLLPAVAEDEKRKILLASDIILLPTYHSETFPTVLIEGMGHGLVPVSYRFRGVEEIVISGVNGFVVERGDVNAMAGIVLRLEDDIMYYSLSVNAFRTSKSFCLNSVVHKIIDIYKDLLRKYEVV